MNRVALCAGVLAVSYGALAGELAPPAGPVASTGRFGPRIELSQANTPGDADSVFKITQPGSYVLANNVQAAAFGSGIEISSSDVTLDLNGFLIQGVATSTFGIRADGPSSRVFIYNGHVSGFAFGLSIGASDSRFEGLIVSDTTVGAALSPNSIVAKCVITDSLDDGLRVGAGSLVVGCIVEQVGACGIDATSDCIIENCIVRSFDDPGLSTGARSTVRNCRVRNGNGPCISVNEESRVSSCEIENGTMGIVAVGDRVLVEGCLVVGNRGTGIDVHSSCVIRECHVADNDGDGVVVIHRCRVDSNVILNNTGRGVFPTGCAGQVVRNYANGNGGTAFQPSDLLTCINAGLVLYDIGSVVGFSDDANVNAWSNFAPP